MAKNQIGMASEKQKLEEPYTMTSEWKHATWNMSYICPMLTNIIFGEKDSSLYAQNKTEQKPKTKLRTILWDICTIAPIIHIHTDRQKL